MTWHKRYHLDALEGMRELTLEQRGAYNTILDLLYLKGGSLPDDAMFISGWLGVFPKTWKRLRSALIDAGKLTSEGGHLANPRASKEMLLSKARSVENKTNGRFGGLASNKNKSIAEANARQTKNKTESLKEEEPKILDIRPSADSSNRPPAGEFDWESSDGTIFVPADQINRWSQQFPGINVRAQLRNARREYLSGPMTTEIFCRRFEKGLKTKADKKRAKEAASTVVQITAKAAMEDEYEARQRALAVRNRIHGIGRG